MKRDKLITRELEIFNPTNKIEVLFTTQVVFDKIKEKVEILGITTKYKLKKGGINEKETI